MYFKNNKDKNGDARLNLIYPSLFLQWAYDQKFIHV